MTSEGSAGATPVTEKGERSRRRRAWFLWLSVILAIFLCLFACGQLSLLRVDPDTSGMASGSALDADYTAWQGWTFGPLLPQIALEAIRDLGISDDPQIATSTTCLLGVTCPTSTPGSGLATPTPGASPTPGVMPSATASIPVPSPTPVSPTNPPAPTPTPAPQVYPVKLANPTRIPPGDTSVSFTILVFNNGSTVPAELRQVIDTLDSHMTVDPASCSPACAVAGGTVTWDYFGPPIDQGYFVSFSFLADVSGTASGDVLTNVASISGDNFRSASTARRVYVFVPPVARSDDYAGLEDTALVVPADGVLANDTDADGHAISASLLDDADHGVLSLQADGSFTYVPDLNWSGTDTFTYEACDPASLCDTATASITVSAVNDAPVAAADSYAVDEDSVLSVALPGVLLNDTDVDSPAASLAAALAPGGDPAHGTLTLNPDGSFVYVPDPDYRGPDSFTYRTSDGLANSIPASVALTVSPLNDTPLPGDDSAAIDEDSFVVVDVLANDVGLGDSPVSVTVISGPSHGTTAVNPVDGSVTYTPALDYRGPDAFQYRVSDFAIPPEVAESATAWVYVTVTPVDDAPVLSNDGPVLLAEDTSTTVAVLANDTLGDSALAGASGDYPILVQILTPPTHGGAIVNLDNTISYTPSADYFGPDALEYAVLETPLGLELSNSPTAILTLTITPVNDAPVAVGDSYSTNEDASLVVPAAFGVLTNDSDIDDPPGDLQALVVLPGGNPLHGTLALNVDGSFSYTPVADYRGPDAFVYRVWDGAAFSNNVTVSLSIIPVDDAPVLRDDSPIPLAEDTPTILPILVNDRLGDNPAAGVSGDYPVFVQIVTPPTNGVASVNADNTITYTPALNYFGGDSLDYTVLETPLGVELANALPATVALTVFPVNDPPFAVPDAYGGVTEDDAVPLAIAAPGVLANDTDIEGDPLEAVLVAGPAGGSIGLALDGSFTYLPDPDFRGSDFFTYQARDSSGALSPAVAVTLLVTPTDDGVDALDDAETTLEDTPVVVDVLANDTPRNTPPRGDTPAIVSIVNPPDHGTPAVQGDGSILYTPDPDWSGTDSFEYLLQDSPQAGEVGQSDTAWVTVTVTPINDPPVAANDGFTVAEDPGFLSPLTISLADLLANDSDVDGPLPLSATRVGDPAHGTVVDILGAVLYWPDDDYRGPDSFSYETCDAAAACDAALVQIDVTPVNDTPSANPDFDSTAEDAALTLDVLANDVLGNDPGLGDYDVTVTAPARADHGDLLVLSDNRIRYTPDANWNGIDSFVYTVTDDPVGPPEVEDSDTAPVSITVLPVNDAPVAVPDGVYAATEDEMLSLPAPGVLSNDTDVELDPLLADLVSGASHGAVVLAIDGSFTYQPDADYFGPDSFTYRAFDGLDYSADATVSIDVATVDDLPDANNDAATTAEDTAVDIDVMANDVLGDDPGVGDQPVTLTGVTDPAHGTAAILAGQVHYTPDEDWNGTDSFSYTIQDADGDSDAADVSIDVAAVDDLPDANNDAASTPEDTAVGIDVLANDAGLGDRPAGILSVTDPPHGSTAVDNNGTPLDLSDDFVAYTPDADWNGTDSFSYTVQDVDGDSDSADVTVDVNPVNDAPVAQDDGPFPTTEDTQLTVPAACGAPPVGVLCNDSDVDLDALAAELVSNATHGTVALGVDGSFTYQPDADYFGPDSFAYRAFDGLDYSADATVSIDVAPVDDQPDANNDAASTAEDSAVDIDVLANDVLGDDPGLGDQPVILTGPTDPAHGSASIEDNGTPVDPFDDFIRYMPDSDWSGADGFSYGVRDADGDTDTADVTVDVAPVNDAPVAVPDGPYTAVEDTLLTVPSTCGVPPEGLLCNDTDIELDPLAADLVGGAAHGSVVLAPDGSFNYQPAPAYHGPDSFVYRAFDGLDYSLPVTVSIDVGSVNDPPVAYPDSESTDQQVPVTIAVLANDTDDGALDPASATCLTNCANVVDNGDGTFTYNPPAGLYDSATFTYQVSDSGGLVSNPATVTININPTHLRIVQAAFPDEGSVGDTINILVWVINDGPGTAYDVQLDSDLGSCFVLRRADDTDLGSIAEGTQQDWGARIRIVDDSDCGTTHTATADAVNASPVSTSVEITILPPILGMSLMMALPPDDATPAEIESIPSGSPSADQATPTPPPGELPAASPSPEPSATAEPSVEPTATAAPPADPTDAPTEPPASTGIPSEPTPEPAPTDSGPAPTDSGPPPSDSGPTPEPDPESGPEVSSEPPAEPPAEPMAAVFSTIRWDRLSRKPVWGGADGLVLASDGRWLLRYLFGLFAPSEALTALPTPMPER